MLPSTIAARVEATVTVTDLARARGQRNLHVKKRDPWGSKWCAAKGVGVVRRELGEPLPPNVALLMERTDPRFEAEKQRQQAAEIWQEFCRTCPAAKACVWGKK